MVKINAHRVLFAISIVLIIVGVILLFTAESKTMSDAWYAYLVIGCGISFAVVGAIVYMESDESRENYNEEKYSDKSIKAE